MSEFVRGVVGRVAIYAAFVMCAALSAILLWEGLLGDKIGHDFSVYWRAANEPALLAYAPHDKPFPYAPTMLLWIAPLGFVSKWTGYFAISLASAAALVVAGRRYLPTPAILLTLISPPFFRCIRNGQVSAILAALMIWACGTSNRIAAGIAFGVTASIKPQLVLMAPLMLALNRDWRAFVSAGLSFVGIVGLSLVIFGPDRWAEWAASLDSFRSAVSGTNVIEIGVSPAIVADHLGYAPLPFLLLGTLAGAVVVYLCRDTEPLEKATAIGLGSLAAAPYALQYDLIVVVPFLAMVLMRGRLLALIGLAAMFNPLPLLVAGFELMRGLASRERRRWNRMPPV